MINRVFLFFSLFFLLLGCQQNEPEKSSNLEYSNYSETLDNLAHSNHPENLDSLNETKVLQQSTSSDGISLSYIQDCALNPVTMLSPCFVIQKFGYNDSVTSITPVPITSSGTYQTPSSAVSGLTIVSTSVNDAYGSSGANLIQITGLDANWELQSEIVAMNGTTPVPLVNDYIRIFTSRILISGTYATASASSYAGEITISAGADVWSKIPAPTSGIQYGEASGCTYTVPKGFSAYVLDGSVFVSEAENKSANIYLYSRSFADNTITPGAILTHYIAHGVKGNLQLFENRLIGRFDGPADLGVMAINNDTGSVQVYGFVTLLFIRN